MSYKLTSASELAVDEYFIQWVQQPTAESDAFWERHLGEDPAQRKAVQEARELVLHLSQDHSPVPDKDLDEVWHRLIKTRENYLARGEEGQQDEEDTVPLDYWRSSRVWMAAAASALLLVSIFFLYQQRERTVTYATTAGQRMQLRLPDSSMVVLNADSKITVPATWGSDTERRVELQGQAFFSVTHKHNNQKFTVVTADGMEVEVLGTEFSVSSREEQKQVVLEKGKISLSMEQMGEEEPFVMAPGDMVEAGADGSLVRTKVQPELYTAWRSSTLILENRTVEEIAQLLKHSYGYQVAVTDQSLLNQRITAYLNVNSPDHILSTLSETLDVAVQKQNNIISISSN
ncbi:MAG: FecR domain-containing protein [Pontibacter sp.]|nr:FecR domain-containing protein [Pontibacter sp.]